MKKLLLLLPLIAFFDAPAMAFFGPSNKLHCRPTEGIIRRINFNKLNIDKDIPRWDFHIEIFNDSISIHRSINNKAGNTQVMPATINRAYVQFKWALLDSDTEDEKFKVLIDRRKNKFSMEANYIDSHILDWKISGNCWRA